MKNLYEIQSAIKDAASDVSDYLTVSGLDGALVSVSADAEQYKLELLASLSSIGVIDSAESLERAAELLKRGREIVKKVEAARKTVKAPVLDVSRRIDDAAKTYTAEIVAACTRLSSDIAAYETLRRKEREEAEAKLRAEQAAIVARAEADQVYATTDAEKEAVLEKAAVAIDQARAAALAEMPARPKGLQVRKVLKFEIVDAAALHAARPDLFSPDETKIRAALKLTRDIAGLRVWEEQKAII